MYKNPIYITHPVGNNSFSYNERITLGSGGKLYIPSLIPGTIANLRQGSEICFEEVSNGKLISCTGLKHFLQTTFHDTPVYIVDNHNHALPFRLTQHVNSGTREPVNLIHIDQHSDTKPNGNKFPIPNLPAVAGSEFPIPEVEDFVNTKTNVGNFITAAINSGIVNEVIQVRTDYALHSIQNSKFKIQNYILDIDIDFRVGKEITEKEINIISQLMDNAKMVTIATSPYFIDQAEAITIIKKLWKE